MNRVIWGGGSKRDIDSYELPPGCFVFRAHESKLVEKFDASGILMPLRAGRRDENEYALDEPPDCGSPREQPHAQHRYEQLCYGLAGIA